jgi:hypothetical protein
MTRRAFAFLVFALSLCFAAPGHAQHSVTLTCTASTSTGVTGYYFYRGAAPGQESSTPLNATAVSTCSYVDTTVSAGAHYFYTAEAYCPTCTPTNSGPSNEISVEIPGGSHPMLWADAKPARRKP